MAAENQAESQLDVQIRAEKERYITLMSLNKNVQDFMGWDENDQTKRNEFVEGLSALTDKAIDRYVNMFEAEAAITPDQKAAREQAQSFSAATAAQALGAVTMADTVVESAQRQGVSGVVAQEKPAPVEDTIIPFMDEVLPQPPQEDLAERAIVLAEIEQKLRSPGGLDVVNAQVQKAMEQIGDLNGSDIDLHFTEARIPEMMQTMKSLPLEDLKVHNSQLGALIDAQGIKPVANAPEDTPKAETPSLDALTQENVKPLLEPAQDWKDMLRTDFDAAKGEPLMSPAIVQAPASVLETKAANDELCVPDAPKEKGFVFSQTEAVGEIQTFLIARNHEELAKPDGTPTTVFGVKTAKALSEELKELQGQWGVEQTGRYDQDTRAALHEAIEAHRSNSEYTSADNLALLERGLNAMQDNVPEGQPNGAKINALDLVFNEGSINPAPPAPPQNAPCEASPPNPPSNVQVKMLKA